MKKIIRILAIALTLGILTTFIAIPVFADDPINVGIGVVTGGDANVNIGIDAGGDVDINVNGGDLANIQDIYNAMSHAPEKGAISYPDLLRWLDKLVYPSLRQLIENDQAIVTNIGLFVQSVGDSNNVTYQRISYLDNQITTLASQQSEINNALAEQDKITWNQLMNGAEYHIGLLQNTVDEQSKTIESLQAQINDSKAEYRAEIKDLKSQGVMYLWISGGFIVLLLGLVIWSLTRKRSIAK